MCQLLAMNCNTPTDIVFSFNGFSQRAGKTSDHVDGWGIAFFEGKAVRNFIDHQSASSSEIASFVKSYPLKSKNVISHIRKATQGTVKLENCHPFVRELWGENYVFAHNGDLKNFEPPLSGRFLPVGQTDSETAFCWLLQNLTTTFTTNPGLKAIAACLQPLADDIAAHGTFNFVLSNGAGLICYSTTNLYYIQRQYPFHVAQLADEDLQIDFSQVTTPNDKVVVVVTEPLTKNEKWTKLIPNQIYLFENGQKV